MKRMMPLVLAALFATAMFQTPAAAVTRQITLGAGYATASVMTSSTAAQFTGAASWHKQYPGAKAESYIDVAATFGTTFTVGQIASVSYHTLAPVVNPSGVDFTMLFYTQPFVGGDASWYGRRLTSEPYLSNGYVAQVPNAWSTWKTGAGANQLTFYDSNHCGNQGFYGSPTLANLGSGPIDWAAWPGNPTAGSATGGAIDYASQPVKFLSFQTGSGWASFNGYLDAITVTLTNGDVYVLDLEGTADPVYANGAWAGSGQGVEVAPGRFFGFNAFATVQTAVNAAIPGGTVEVAAGTFTEQVVVNGKNLTIHGAGRSSTILQSPVTLAASFSTPTVNRPIVLCENAADIRVVNLRVDGAGRGNGNARFIGVGFWNAGGKVIDCDVVHVRETPFNGVQSGVGVYSFDNTGGPYAIEIGNCAISDYQKNAMALNGPGITVNVHDCTAAGVGGTNLIAQNGIQIAFGAGGTVSRCNVSDICYLPNTTVGCAFLFYSGTGVSSDGLTVSNGQVGVLYEAMPGSASHVSVSGNITGVPSTGVLVQDDDASLMAQAATAGAAAPHVTSPVGEEGAATARSRATHASSTTMNVALDTGCLVGDGLAGSIGVQFYSYGGPLVGSASHLELSNWADAFQSGGANVTTTVQNNSITACLAHGFASDVGLANDARLNWWGAASGPSGVAPGAGSAVTADVIFAPFRISGADLTAGCGFTPGADNVIAAGPAPSCITPANACVTIPVTIARTTSDQVRGFSMHVQLSSNLQLCSGPSSITEGSYLNSVSGTSFQVIDNGGGDYTVDGVILGAPCGATAATGTLFALAVKKVGPDGVGTITLASTVLRDCDNAPVAASAGAPLAITIDSAPPSTIAGLTATQKRTGNDADGTTKIQIAFPAPSGASSIEVYRAGFGHYPEYDDAGGAVPATPSYPPSAPWALTGVTASGQYDEPATRDFWYYVAFSKDACGNVSAVSNVTGGTLDYFLGDVSNGFTLGTGDNQVSTVDISLLGANYGITLAPFDPVNYLDVGPTTNNSVNGRPTTDNKLNFEDLILFAINYGLVSAPQDGVVPAAATASDAIRTKSAAAHAAGDVITVPVLFDGAGDVQGASVQLAFDPAVVEFVSASPGELLGRQGRQSVVLSPSAGVVDVALLGVGTGITGTGTLLDVTFRALRSGDPAVMVANVKARDAENHPIALTGARPVLPTQTALSPAFPNPFGHTTRLDLAIARPGHVSVMVYDLGGRLVRKLVEGDLPASKQTLQWDGTDDGGRSLPAGLYLVRMEAPGATMSHRIVRMP